MYKRVELTHAYINCHLDDAKSTTTLINMIYSLITNHRLNILDDQLLLITKGSIIAMVALLRTTFSIRSKLPNWNIAVKLAELEIDSRGENSAVILNGLLEK